MNLSVFSFISTGKLGNMISCISQCGQTRKHFCEKSFIGGILETLENDTTCTYIYGNVTRATKMFLKDVWKTFLLPGKQTLIGNMFSSLPKTEILMSSFFPTRWSI